LANDGTVKIGAELDESGFKKGLKGLGSLTQAGMSALAKTSVAAIGAAASGVIALGKYAADVGSDFEAGMSRVSAISGAVGDDLTKLADKAKEMGAKTKFSATEASEAMQYMAMAGWETEEMLSGIEGIMNLAAADGLDLATTSDIVTDALTAFGLSAADSGHFADVLAKASSSANTNVSMMGETFKYVAPVAGALGYSVEDCSVAIGLMANSSIKGSQAGTYLRAILSRMTKPTDEVAIAMEDLGISLTNSDGSMKSLGKVMEDMRGGFAGLTEEQRATYAAMIGGQEAMSGLLAIVTASDDDFRKLTAAIADADRAASEMAETMQNNLQGQLTILKGAAEGLGLAIYEDLQQPLTDLAKVGIEAVNQLTDAFKEGGASGLAKAGADLIADLLLGAAEKLPDLISLASDVVVSLFEGINENLPQLMEAGGEILRSLAEGVLAAAPQIALTAGGIVGSLVQGLIDNMPAIAVQAQEILLGLLAGFQENLPVIVQTGAEFLTSLIQGIASMLPELVPAAINTIIVLAEALLDNLPTIIDAGIQLIFALAEGLMNALPTLIEKVPRIINDFWDEFDANLWKIIQAGGELIAKLGKGVIDSIPLLIANAGEIVKAIFKTITRLDMIGMGKKLITNLGNGIKGMLSFIKNSAKQVIEKIKHPFSEMSWSEIGKNIIDGVKNGVLNAASSLVDAAKNTVSNAVNGVKNFLRIKSPSRLMRDLIGKNMIAGIGVGIEMESDHLEADARKSAEGAVNAMQKTMDAGAFVAGMQAEAERFAGAMGYEISAKDNRGRDDVPAGFSDIKKFEVEVPVYLDSREIARGTAEINGEQMEWEDIS
jgi:TP901 family phage tail tape measure protein